MAERKTADPSWNEIERRAYELYLERGGDDGYDVDDWVQAERELMGVQTERGQGGPQVGSHVEPRRTVERSSERSADRSGLSDSLNRNR